MKKLHLSESIKYIARQERRAPLLGIMALLGYYFLSTLPQTQPELLGVMAVLVTVTSLFGLLLYYKLNQAYSERLGRFSSYKLVATYSLVSQFNFGALASLCLANEAAPTWGTLFACVCVVSTCESGISNYAAWIRVSLCNLMFALTLPSLALVIYQGEQGLILACVALAYFLVQWTRIHDISKYFTSTMDYKISVELEKQRLQDFFNFIPAKVSWFDENLRYKAVNESLLRVLGSGANEMIGKELGYKSHEDGAMMRERMKKFKDDGKEEQVFEVGVTLPGGEERRHQFMLKRVLVNNSFEYIMMSIDVEDQKRLSEMFEVEKEKNLHNAHLAALGEMAAGIAHEIKNPLTIIKTNSYLISNLLKAPVVATDAIMSKAQKISLTTDRIVKIVNGLRNLSRQNHGTVKVSVSLKDLLEDPLSVCTERFRSENVRLEVDVLDENHLVYVDAQQVGQVLVNLLSNAFDANCESTEADKERIIYLGAYSDAVWDYIEVKDNGPGVPNPEKLFQPFFTTKEPGKGTGLGLSISKRIIENHGGKISYLRDSMFTCFQLKLPKATPASKPKADPLAS